MPQGVWVQVPLPAPSRSKRYKACSDLFYKSARTYAADLPFQPANASLILGHLLNAKCINERIPALNNLVLHSKIRKNKAVLLQIRLQIPVIILKNEENHPDDFAKICSKVSM